jgi:hypothetical protein
MLLAVGFVVWLLLWFLKPTSLFLLLASIVSGVILALALALIRLALTRYVRIDIESCTVPSGFLRLKPKQVAYASIREVSERFMPFNIAVLRISDQDSTVKIVAALMRDARTYAELRSYFFERKWESQDAAA